MYIHNHSINTILLKTLWGLLPVFTIYGMIVYIHPLLADETGIVIQGSIGNFSSLADTGTIIPIEIKPCCPDVQITRYDTTSYGITLIMETPFWLYPSLGFHFARQLVDDIRGEIWGGGSLNSINEGHMSLKASSTTTFVWSDFGVETSIPRRTESNRKSWRSLIIGAGGSLIYAEDRVHQGSKYTYYSKRSVYDIMNDVSGVLEIINEEKDLGGFSSSGLDLGWYALLGLQFHFSQSFSFIIKTQTNFGSVELNMKNGNSTKELTFTNGTIEIATSYKF